MVYQKTEWKDHVVDQSTGKLIQQGTPVSAKNLNKIEQGIADAHNILETSSRLKQTLKTGVQVVNGDISSLVGIQMEGLTLVPMQNNVLEGTKYYVLAAPNYKIKYLSGEQIAGVAKFQGKGERASLIRVASFEGKRSGSTLENPHIFKRTQYDAMGVADTVLEPTNNNYIEADDNILARIATLDGNTNSLSNVKNGNMSQVLLGFDLVQEIERRLGRIPRNTLADKVQWCKDNINFIAIRWYGYGSSPAGNKAYLKLWQPGTSSYYGTGATHTSSNIAVLTGSVQKDTGTLKTTDIIDANGFVFGLAHTDASDGATPSTLVTDYVSMEIELKRDAILLDPRVPLYEVPKNEYDNILTTWNASEVEARYPSVAGVQHIQNPYIMAEGENLLPPFSDWLASGPNSINNELLSPYEVVLNAPGTGTYTLTYEFDVVPGQKYTFKAEQENRGTNVGVVIRTPGNESTIDNFEVQQIPEKGRTFTIPSGVKRIYLRLFNATPVPGVSALIKNPILILGENLKFFKPRNPSYLFALEKLGKAGNVSDLLYEEDGKYWVRKVVAKDVIIDGTISSFSAIDLTGYKRFILAGFVTEKGMKSLDTTAILTNDKGVSLRGYSSDPAINEVSNGYHAGNTAFNITVPDTETGFTESQVPNVDEIRAYFNGWKAKTVDTNGRVTAWVSTVDGTDAPTQTAAYVTANNPVGYTQYKLTFALANPKTEEARVEGSVTVNGPTQIEVGTGVIVREKANFVINGQNTSYNINSNSIAGTALKYRVAKFFNLYKGNIETNDYFIVRDQFAIGNERLGIEKEKFDTKAEYYVTYLLWDKQLFATNPVNVIAQYASNIRAALEDTVKKTEDNSRDITVQANIIYDVLKRLKAGGL